MLLVMSYEALIFIAIVCGLSTGYFVVMARAKSTSKLDVVVVTISIRVLVLLMEVIQMMPLLSRFPLLQEV